MAAGRNFAWKILAMGRGANTAAKAEEHLHQLGYKNVKAVGVTNDQASDNKVLELLKTDDWDAVSIGGGLNGYDERIAREVATLHWFNRIVNLIHQNAPKTKFIFVTNPDDIADSIHRVLDCQEKPPGSA